MKTKSNAKQRQHQSGPPHLFALTSACLLLASRCARRPYERGTFPRRGGRRLECVGCVVLRWCCVGVVLVLRWCCLHLRWRCKSWCFVGVARASCCSLSSSGLRAHSSIALLHRKHDSFPSVWGVPQHASTLHNLLSRGPIHSRHGPMDNVSFTLGHPNCFVHNTCQSNVYMLRARECVHNFLQTAVLRVGGVRGGWFCCARSIYIHTHTPRLVQEVVEVVA